MKDMAIAYYEWSQEITYDRNTYKFVKGKGKDLIRTRGGELYAPDEWVKKIFTFVKANDLEDLYLQIKEYVHRTCPWVKQSDEVQYALDCLLHESYLKWDDFCYQERLKI